MIISEKLKIYFNAQFQCQTKSETYGVILFGKHLQIIKSWSLYLYQLVTLMATIMFAKTCSSEYQWVTVLYPEINWVWSRTECLMVNRVRLLTFFSQSYTSMLYDLLWARSLKLYIWKSESIWRRLRFFETYYLNSLRIFLYKIVKKCFILIVFNCLFAFILVALYIFKNTMLVTCDPDWAMGDKIWSGQVMSEGQKDRRTDWSP